MIFKSIIFTLAIFCMPCFAVEKADHVLVEKARHTLTLFKNGKVIKSDHVVFGGNPVGHKQQEGDERTPEGKYVLDSKNAKSAYYKSIHISYPNAKDLEVARKKGVSAGSAIMIHGQKNGFEALEAQTQKFNWTLGCIALTNSDMEDVWNKVDVPVGIEIKP
jgi:murein L,D-transpeptidase YafK